MLDKILSISRDQKLYLCNNFVKVANDLGIKIATILPGINVPDNVDAQVIDKIYDIFVSNLDAYNAYENSIGSAMEYRFKRDFISKVQLEISQIAYSANKATEAFLTQTFLQGGSQDNIIGLSSRIENISEFSSEEQKPVVQQETPAQKQEVPEQVIDESQVDLFGNAFQIGDERYIKFDDFFDVPLFENGKTPSVNVLLLTMMRKSLLKYKEGIESLNNIKVVQNSEAELTKILVFLYMKYFNQKKKVFPKGMPTIDEAFYSDVEDKIVEYFYKLNHIQPDNLVDSDETNEPEDAVFKYLQQLHSNVLEQTKSKDKDFSAKRWQESAHYCYTCKEFIPEQFIYKDKEGEPFLIWWDPEAKQYYFDPSQSGKPKEDLEKKKVCKALFEDEKNDLNKIFRCKYHKKNFGEICDIGKNLVSFGKERNEDAIMPEIMQYESKLLIDNVSVESEINNATAKFPQEFVDCVGRKIDEIDKSKIDEVSKYRAKKSIAEIVGLSINVFFPQTMHKAKEASGDKRVSHENLDLLIEKLGPFSKIDPKALEEIKIAGNTQFDKMAASFRDLSQTLFDVVSNDAQYASYDEESRKFIALSKAFSCIFSNPVRTLFGHAFRPSSREVARGLPPTGLITPDIITPETIENEQTFNLYHSNVPENLRLPLLFSREEPKEAYNDSLLAIFKGMLYTKNRDMYNKFYELIYPNMKRRNELKKRLGDQYYTHPVQRFFTPLQKELKGIENDLVQQLKIKKVPFIQGEEDLYMIGGNAIKQSDFTDIVMDILTSVGQMGIPPVGEAGEELPNLNISKEFIEKLKGINDQEILQKINKQRNLDQYETDPIGIEVNPPYQELQTKPSWWEAKGDIAPRNNNPHMYNQIFQMFTLPPFLQSKMLAESFFVNMPGGQTGGETGLVTPFATVASRRALSAATLAYYMTHPNEYEYAFMYQLIELVRKGYVPDQQRNPFSGTFGKRGKPGETYEFTEDPLFNLLLKISGQFFTIGGKNPALEEYYSLKGMGRQRKSPGYKDERRLNQFMNPDIKPNANVNTWYRIAQKDQSFSHVILTSAHDAFIMVKNIINANRKQLDRISLPFIRVMPFSAFGSLEAVADFNTQAGNPFDALAVTDQQYAYIKELGVH